MEKNDLIRGPGSFQKTLEAIHSCRSVDLPVVVMMCALQKNKDDALRVQSLLEGEGVQLFSIRRFVPTGRGACESGEYLISKDENNALFEEWFSRSLESCISMNFHDALYPRFVLEKVMRNPLLLAKVMHGFVGKTKRLKSFSMNSAMPGCAAGKKVCTILPDGTVWPCPNLQVEVGNILEKSLRELWRESKVVQDLQDRRRLKGRCGSCKIRWMCGGCRAYAHATTGDYLAEDSMCFFH
jgi:radical SAM protein with 4Fe4S-binding SPASM domain